MNELNAFRDTQLHIFAQWAFVNWKKVGDVFFFLEKTMSREQYVCNQCRDCSCYSGMFNETIKIAIIIHNMIKVKYNDRLKYSRS